MNALLQGQPVLILDATSDALVEALLDALVGVGAAPLLAADGREALEYLERYEFSAVLIGETTPFEKSMLDALGGLPIILFGRPGHVTAAGPISATVKRDVPSILTALKGSF